MPPIKVNSDPSQFVVVAVPLVFPVIEGITVISPNKVSNPQADPVVIA